LSLPNFQVDRVRCNKISGDAQVNESLGVGGVLRELLAKNRVAVEKLLAPKFAKIKSR
jgi:hypothetical protein